jgi:branched-chain amino acid transport system substrate-binding protein
MKNGWHKARAALAALTLALSAAGAAAQNAPIKVVGSLDLSGALSALGEDALAGYQFAVETLNRKGGVLGRQVSFEHQDNGSNPQRAVTQAGALVQQGAALLLSPVSSGGTLAVSKLVSGKMKVPMAVAISAAEEITMKDYQPNVYSTAPNTYMLMRAVAIRLAKQPYKRYALMVPDYAGGRSAAVRFKEFMKELNPQAEIVAEEYPKLGALDYTPSINKILAAKPDYVWAQIYSADMATFAKQAKAVDFFKQINNRFMTVLDTKTLKALGEYAPVGTDGYQYAPFNYLEKTPEAKDFVAQFKAKTGNYPSDWAIAAYDSVMVWAQAVAAAKSTDSEALFKAIETQPFPSLRGPLRFGKDDHQGDVPIYFGKVAAGKEYGQPVLEIDDVVPAKMTLPPKAVVEAARKG